MAETLKQKISVKQTGSTGAGKPADMRSSTQVIDDLKTLSESSTTEAPPEMRKELRDAIRRAEGSYQDRAKQNEWLEVAQTLGRAVAQFGAAQAGMKSGHDMSNLSMGGTIDYGARTDRAFKEYQQTLGLVSDDDKRDRSNWAARADSQKNTFENKRGSLRDELSNSQKVEDDQRNATLQWGLESSRAARDAKRDDDRDRKDREKADHWRDEQDLKDLANQERTLLDRLKKRGALVSSLQNDGDLKSKTADKLEATYGRLAGEADLNLSDLKTELEGATKEDTILGVIPTTSPDPDKQKQIYQSKVDEVKDMLAAIQKRRADILARKAEGPGAEPSVQPQKSTEAPTQKTPTDAQVKTYMERNNVDEATAKSVLTQRLNKK